MLPVSVPAASVPAVAFSLAAVVVSPAAVVSLSPAATVSATAVLSPAAVSDEAAAVVSAAAVAAAVPAAKALSSATFPISMLAASPSAVPLTILFPLIIFLIALSPPLHLYLLKLVVPRQILPLSPLPHAARQPAYQLYCLSLCLKALL